MNSFGPEARRFPATLTAVITPLLLALALTLSGCATRKQVAEIVANSNAALIAGQLPDLPPAQGQGARGQSWEEISARIDAFAEAHPEQKATVAPLRIRQAMLLLAHHQLNLADAAFNQASTADLHTDRDLALKANRAQLRWWFGASTNDTWSADDRSKSKAALEALRAEQIRLERSPAIRDYLAEMRAWIGIGAARQTASVDQARLLLSEALDTYATIFTSGDLSILASGQEPADDARVGSQDLRRRLRARAVLTEAKRLNQTAGLDAHPANPTFDRLIQ